VTECRWLGLGCTTILRLAAHVRRHASGTSIVKFLSQSFDLGIIVLLHLYLSLFKLEYLGSDHLHLLDLTVDLIFIVFRTSALAIEFLSHLIQELVETIGRNASMLGPVHGDEIDGLEWRKMFCGNVFWLFGRCNRSDLPIVRPTTELLGRSEEVIAKDL
jgi:hypothetical protein